MNRDKLARLLWGFQPAELRNHNGWLYCQTQHCMINSILNLSQDTSGIAYEYMAGEKGTPIC